MVVIGEQDAPEQAIDPQMCEHLSMRWIGVEGVRQTQGETTHGDQRHENGESVNPPGTATNQEDEGKRQDEVEVFLDGKAPGVGERGTEIILGVEEVRP